MEPIPVYQPLPNFLSNKGLQITGQIKVSLDQCKPAKTFVMSPKFGNKKIKSINPSKPQPPTHYYLDLINIINFR